MTPWASFTKKCLFILPIGSTETIFACFSFDTFFGEVFVSFIVFPDDSALFRAVSSTFDFFFGLSESTKALPSTSALVLFRLFSGSNATGSGGTFSLEQETSARENYRIKLYLLSLLGVALICKERSSSLVLFNLRKRRSRNSMSSWAAGRFCFIFSSCLLIFSPTLRYSSRRKASMPYLFQACQFCSKSVSESKANGLYDLWVDTKRACFAFAERENCIANWHAWFISLLSWLKNPIKITYFLMSSVQFQLWLILRTGCLGKEAKPRGDSFYFIIDFDSCNRI